MTFEESIDKISDALQLSIETIERRDAEIELLRASHAELLAAAKGLLRFNEELCADIGVSEHYPSAEKARAAIAKAEESAP